MKFLSTVFSILMLSAYLAVGLPGVPNNGTNTKANTNSYPPTITRPPISQIVTQGNTIRLSVIASNPNKSDKVLKYQWSKNGNLIPGATNYYIDFINIQYTNQGLYSVTLTNSTGGTSAAGSLTVPTTNILNACVVSNTVNVLWSYDYVHNPDLGYFNIFYGTDKVNYGTNIIVNKTNATAAIHNLLSGKTYYFMALAVSTNGIQSSSSPQLSQVLSYFCGIPYTIDIVMLTNNVPRLTAKLCPGCVVGIQRSLNLTTNWITIGSTSADKYGNIIYDDYTTPTNNAAFYRLITQ